MKVTILGGGFGLYGYLPALVQSCQVTVVLPTRYQATLESRKDVRGFANQIEWVHDQDAILDICDAVVFALPPKQQFDWVKKCLMRKNITHLFLEKPLASSPQLADELLNLLETSNKKFRIGYNFRYTNWGKAFLNNSNPIQSVNWDFRAHHYANNIQTWKRVHADGGGALRFYGIHLIALMAEAGYKDVNFSQISSEAETWKAVLTNTLDATCNISVATNTNNIGFLVGNNNTIVHSGLDPFQSLSHTDVMDKRIPFLVEGLTDLFGDTETYYAWYKQVNLLWHKIEALS